MKNILQTYRSRKFLEPLNTNGNGTIQCHFSPRIGENGYPDCNLKISDCTFTATIHIVPNDDDSVKLDDYLKKLSLIKEEIEKYISFLVTNKAAVQALYHKCDEVYHKRKL